MHIPPHPHILLPSVSSAPNGPVTLTEEEFRRLLYIALSAVYVDETWYLNAYPDVQAAVASGTISSATEHYRSSGYLEGRFPFNPLVDEHWYKEKYADIKAAINAGVMESSASHFFGGGYREGRIAARPVVDEKWYLKNYSEVERAIQRGDFASATDHFELEGYCKGYLPARAVSLR